MENILLFSELRLLKVLVQYVLGRYFKFLSFLIHTNNEQLLIYHSQYFLKEE